MFERWGGGTVGAEWLTRKMARHAEKVADPCSKEEGKLEITI